MAHEARVRVGIRWRDLDMLGHLNQAVYHELLEEGRASLFTEIGIVPFVIARVELDHRSEIRKDHGEVEIVTTPESVGNSSIVVAQQILLPDGTVAAEGRCVLVAWDPQARTKRTLTDRERAHLVSEPV
jgi:acyl-CoA thioester hydrolase